jgi:hypothetical protein
LTRPFIRYFALTDDSPVGRVSFEYMRGLLRIGPVRVATMSAGLSGRWELFAPLLVTPLPTSGYVNVVCCLPGQWSWIQRIPMPNLDAQGKVASTDVATHRVELYTVGVRNVLLVGSPPPGVPAQLQETLTTALRYQAFVVPTFELGEKWMRLSCHPQVIPVPIFDPDSLRDVLQPEGEIRDD